MSSFIIKIIAIISMTIDHVNDIFYKQTALNVIGRIAFPLFCFQIVVGYSKTRNLLKYILRLVVFAIITQVPYYFFMKEIGAGFSLNVLCTLVLGLIAIYFYDMKFEKSSDNVSIIDVKRK